MGFNSSHDPPTNSDEIGADSGNRTRISTLEASNDAIIPYPHMLYPLTEGVCHRLIVMQMVRHPHDPAAP